MNDNRKSFERECLTTVLRDAAMLVQEGTVPVVGVALARESSVTVLTVEVQVDDHARARLQREVWPSELSGGFMADTFYAALIEWWEVGRYRGGYAEDGSATIL